MRWFDGGEKRAAGDLPVERPTKVEFLINLRTAKVLGLEIPLSLLIRVDDLVE